MKKAILILRRNAALDREEIDFLWWVQISRSRLLNRSLSNIKESTRLVAAGIEAAEYLRRMPCEVHKELVLRTLDVNPSLDLPSLLADIGADDCSILGKRYTSGIANQVPSVFPLLNALATRSADIAGAGLQRSCEEWAARALLEAGLVQFSARQKVTNE